jgi:hypothetical protein
MLSSSKHRIPFFSSLLDLFLKLTVQRYFSVPAGSPTETFRPLTGRYPVFELIPNDVLALRKGGPFDMTFKGDVANNGCSFKAHSDSHATDGCRARQFLLGISCISN